METLELENNPQLFPSVAVGNKIMFILRSSDPIVSNILVQSKQGCSPKITKPRDSTLYNPKSSVTLGSAPPKPNCYFMTGYFHSCKPQKVGKRVKLLRHQLNSREKY